MKRTVAILMSLGMSGLAGLQASQTARDQGIVRINVGSGQRKLITVPVARAISLEGTVVSAAANSITETAAFTNGEFNEAAGDNKYELEITSGRHIGLILPVVSNSVDAVYVNGTLPPSTIPVGTTYVIRKSWTPIGLFGSTTTQVGAKGVTGANSPTVATQIEQLTTTNGLQFGQKVFFRSSVNQWRNTDASAGDQGGIRLGSTFMMFQPGGLSAASVKLTGEVRKTRTLFPVGGAAANSISLIGNPNPFATTFSGSGLRNTFGASSTSNSVTGANSPTASDEVRQYFPSTATLSNYFFRSTVSSWVGSVGGANKDGQSIAAGEGMIIKRQPAGQGFVGFNAIAQ